MITAFMISIRAVGTDLLEVRIQIEQLNIDDAGTTTGLLQIPVAPEQVATFLGQQIIPHAAPVVIQALTTQHVQHQSVSNKAAVSVVVAAAVVVVIVGGAVVGGFIGYGFEKAISVVGGCIEYGFEKAIAVVGGCIEYGFEKAINEDIEFKNSIGISSE
ncbi:hypothetical protein [Endozoicomonas numazuensis]|uniref:hypothetical protein n=1 Tax=Endozoicomonas numazuensis TaxID=1137799 RepID=UPI001F1ED3EF|nr:hypothetical protein [Endozoicomonas numazuensis]